MLSDNTLARSADQLFEIWRFLGESRDLNSSPPCVYF